VKRRLVGLFLVAFALWPLLHFAATTRYGVDPWKLFGWAMYCVPGPLKTLRVVAILEENELRRLDYRAYAATDQRLVDTYRNAGERLAISPPGMRSSPDSSRSTRSSRES